jgi:superfamily II DNA/RNA helicase
MVSVRRVSRAGCFGTKGLSISFVSSPEDDDRYRARRRKNSLMLEVSEELRHGRELPLQTHDGAGGSNRKPISSRGRTPVTTITKSDVSGLCPAPTSARP